MPLDRVCNWAEYAPMKRDGHFERAIDLESVTDASNRSGISRTWLYKLMRSESLDYYQFGNRKMVHRGDIDKLIAQRSNKRTGLNGHDHIPSKRSARA